MLIKLIKYDFKALNRFLIMIHIMLLITALLGRVVFVDRVLQNPESLSEVGMAIVAVGIILFCIMFMVAGFGTQVFSGIYFYRNLFSDEGYLTHTLPVSRTQLLVSKSIVASVWMFIDQLLLIGSVLILVLVDPVLEVMTTYRAEVWEVLGLPPGLGYGAICLIILVLCLVSAVSSIALLYASVVIGQMFANHRALGAVVVYFCISTVLSVIASIWGILSGSMEAAAVSQTTSLYMFYKDLFAGTLVFELIFAIVFYAVAWILMRKRLNLN